MNALDSVLGWMAIGAAASLAAMIWPFLRGGAGVIIKLLLGPLGAIARRGPQPRDPAQRDLRDAPLLRGGRRDRGAGGHAGLLAPLRAVEGPRDLTARLRHGARDGAGAVGHVALAANDLQ